MTNHHSGGAVQHAKTGKRFRFFEIMFLARNRLQEKRVLLGLVTQPGVHLFGFEFGNRRPSCDLVLRCCHVCGLLIPVVGELPPKRVLSTISRAKSRWKLIKAVSNGVWHFHSKSYSRRLRVVHLPPDSIR